MQTNIEVDSIETFNLDNYSDFSIKINDSNVSTEINPIELERFRDNLKSAIEERGLSYSADSNLEFNINQSRFIKCRRRDYKRQSSSKRCA